MNQLTRAIKSEWLKVFSTRVWWALALVMVIYIGFTASMMGFMVSGILEGLSEEELGIVDPQSIYTLGSSMGYIFPVLIGSLAITGEWRHRTITPTFLAAGRRGPVLAGKTIVQFGMGMFYGVLALTAAVIASVALITHGGASSGLGEVETWTFFARSILVMGVWAAIGVGLGVLVRNQTAAVVIVIAFTQFVEPLARLAAPFNEVTASVGRFLPGAATDAFVGDSLYTAMTAGAGGRTLESWQALLVLVGYATVLLTVGWVARWRSADVT